MKEKKKGLMNLILQYWNIMGYQNLKAYDSESTRYTSSYQERLAKVTKSQSSEEMQLQQNHQMNRGTENEGGIFCINIPSV